MPACLPACLPDKRKKYGEVAKKVANLPSKSEAGRQEAQQKKKHRGMAKKVANLGGVQKGG